MEPYGYIVPMAHSGFLEGAQEVSGRKSGVFYIIRSVSAGGYPHFFGDKSSQINSKKRNNIKGAVTMYFHKKRVIAMLLAGGQGSRLKVLTE